MRDQTITHRDLAIARDERYRYNNPVVARGNQMGFAMVEAVIRSKAPIARRIALRIKGMQ
jgi:hypothetical protein